MMILQRHLITNSAMMVAFFLSTTVRGFSPFLRKSSSSKRWSSSCRSSSTSTSIPFCAAMLNGNSSSSNGNGSIKKKTKLFSTTSSSADETKEKETTQTRIPITLLAGFLGSGKTTTLQNLLSNKEGAKIGIIVNDMANINIDSKLLNNPNMVIGDEETLELQNGCACCSLADELIASVGQLTLYGERDLDHIVVELSGVADPEAVKKNWKSAQMMNHPVTKFAKMDKIVTLVDSSTFGTDWMSWDQSGDREGWMNGDDSCGGTKNVPELLSEQIEAADVLIVNKIDLAGEEQVKVASNLVKVLNDKASIHEAKFGEISIKDVLGAPSVKTAIDCADPNCTDPTHSHSHDHTEHSATDDHHSQSHDHSHDNNASTCADSTCTDSTHNHSHNHDHDQDDSTCTDSTHDHSHSHDHGSHLDNLGIKSFVYKSNRPFHAIRLMAVLHTWPIPVKDELDLGLLEKASNNGVEIDGITQKSPFVGVLRSKGFCWMSPTKWFGPGQDMWRHNTAMYWSQAGKHFGVTTAGNWWAKISKEQMREYFVNNEKEYERILKEDFVTDEFGDRRQEIVFIGANIDETEITEALDECLCTDEEMEAYRKDLATLEQMLEREIQ